VRRRAQRVIELETEAIVERLVGRFEALYRGGAEPDDFRSDPCGFRANEGRKRLGALIQFLIGADAHILIGLKARVRCQARGLAIHVTDRHHGFQHGIRTLAERPPQLLQGLGGLMRARVGLLPGLRRRIKVGQIPGGLCRCRPRRARAARCIGRRSHYAGQSQKSKGCRNRYALLHKSLFLFVPACAGYRRDTLILSWKYV